ncbi:spore germination protein [Bacillus sp. T3]|uniref:spore germination protein n=1 Tax=Bacillus sp. T3 TaxID=467262 RepID=UPI002982648D|nr:spore germination protein [Bacillus sp. T3]
MRFFKNKLKKSYPQAKQWGQEQVNMDDTRTSSDLDENIEKLKAIFGNTSDLEIQIIQIVDNKGIVVYLKSMVDINEVNSVILQPLAQLNQHEYQFMDWNDMEMVRQKIFSGLSYQAREDVRQITVDLLNGYVLILVNRNSQAYLFSLSNTDYRSISEPTTQTVIRGPKDSFNESLQVGMTLIRRRIRNPRLQFEEFVVGTESRTAVAISYMNGVVDEGVLNEVRRRIQDVNLTALFDSGNLDEAIADETFTTFPLIFNTERPDVVAAGIIEGKVAILVDGSPFVLLAPTVLTDFFQSPEDYYHSFLIGTFMRLVRYVSFMVAMVFPSLYVALVTFHHELIPTELLISVQAQRQGVPFPAVIEIVLMEFTFEVLREAGVRMPRAVGQTVSIVGALVLGQAVVEAGLVSNVLVIVVAFTAIASFVSPIYNFSTPTRLLRFAFILAAAALGLYGVLLSLILMVAHLVSLRSFGVPYLAPVAPFIVEDQGEVFFRVPSWADLRKPSYLNSKTFNKGKVSKPKPPQKGGGDEKSTVCVLIVCFSTQRLLGYY